MTDYFYNYHNHAFGSDLYSRFDEEGNPPPPPSEYQYITKSGADYVTKTGEFYVTKP